MPLQFETQRQQQCRRRRLYAAAGILLVLVLAVLSLWLVTRYYQSQADNRKEEDTSSAPVADAPPGEAATSLLILNEPSNPQFLLIHADPSRQQITLFPVPGNLGTADGQVITALLQKHGPLRVKQAVESALEFPISHYMALTVADAVTFLKDLEGGVTFTLPEAVPYQDENGTSLRLESGQRQLTGAQMGAVLRHTGWKKAANKDTVPAMLVATVINQHWVANRSFNGLFASLANVMESDIRIDHYNAYRDAVVFLADGNIGSLAGTRTLPGSTNNQGLFVPDIAALRQDTHLYSD